MSKVIFGRWMSVICLAGSLIASQASAEADSPQSGVDECSKELLLSYFPEVFVNETLKKFDVPEDQWKAINTELSSKNDSVIKLVEEKASKMDPNPLKDPSQRQAAVKIFRDTLFEVFSGVLKDHGVTDEQKVRSMLEDIQHQKAIRFAQCMEKKLPMSDGTPAEDKQKEPAVQGQPTPDLSMADSPESTHETATQSSNDASKESESKENNQDDDKDDDNDDDNDDDDDEESDSEKSQK